MTLAEVVEQKKEAMRVEDVARVLGISIKQIYKMAAKRQIPSIKIANCVRFDPHDIATWLRSQSSTNPIPTVSLPNRTHLKRHDGQLLDHSRRIDRRISTRRSGS